MTIQSNDHERARESRERRLIRAEMCSDRLAAHDILIRNVSSWGLGATSRGALPPIPDEQVSIRLPDGQIVTGVVRWNDGKVFGVQLDRLIKLQALLTALQHLKEQADIGASFEVKSRHRVTTWRPDEANLRRI